MTSEQAKVLVGKLRRIQEAEADALRIMRACAQERADLLAGGGGIGQAMKDAREFFETQWSAQKSGAKYVWAGDRDMSNLKRIIQEIGIDDFRVRAARYVVSAGDEAVKSNHGFGWFVVTVNQWAGGALLDDGESEIERTRRRQASVRQV